MSDELIGKSEVTWELVNALENLADAQQQCEAQFVAAIYHKRALDDRRVDVNKAFDACRKFECLDVDKMMEQKFVVTSQMIDDYRAELLGQTSAPVSADADELNDLSPHEGEEDQACVRGIIIPEGFTPWMGQYGLPADVDEDDDLEMITANGIIHRQPAYALTWKWATEVHTINDIVAYKPFKFGEEEGDPQAYAETLMANAAEMGVEDAFKNLNKAADIMQDRAAEIDAPAYETVTGTEIAQPVEQEAEPDGVRLIKENQERLDRLVEKTGELVDHAAEPAPAPERKFKAGDRVRDKLRSENGTVTGYTEMGSVEFQIDGRNLPSLAGEEELELIVDHAAEATAQIEAQAESESTEPEAELPEFDEGDVVYTLGGEKRIIKNYWPETDEDTESFDLIGEDGTTYWDVSPDTLAIRSAQPQSTEPDAASDETVTEQPEQTVHVFGEGEVQTFGEEGVFTEQPETPEPEFPSQPEEPKAERKSYDFTGDYTQEEVLAQSGNANFDPRENQPDDIAATERAEFDAPRRQFYNPWNTTAKAEG